MLRPRGKKQVLPHLPLASIGGHLQKKQKASGKEPTETPHLNTGPIASSRCRASPSSNMTTMPLDVVVPYCHTPTTSMDHSSPSHCTGTPHTSYGPVSKWIVVPSQHQLRQAQKVGSPGTGRVSRTIEGMTNGRRDRWMDGWMEEEEGEGWVDGWKLGCVDAWMRGGEGYGWMDGRRGLCVSEYKW
jgi:hypothetical protein